MPPKTAEATDAAYSAETAEISFRRHDLLPLDPFNASLGNRPLCRMMSARFLSDPVAVQPGEPLSQPPTVSVGSSLRSSCTVWRASSWLAELPLRDRMARSVEVCVRLARSERCASSSARS